MEEETDHCIKYREAKKVPGYDEQLEVFEKDTLRDIEEFRAARSTWLMATKKEMPNTKENVHQDKTNVYNGRCLFLRRMRLKTNGLRRHFLTLRPKMFYTLRQKVTSLEAFEERERAKLELEKCLNDKEWAKTFYKDFLGTEAEAEQKELEESLKKKKRKKEKVKYRQVKTPGPCEKAMKKLRAAKLQSRVIESCKCDDGREVTVVIKGFCLCDKTGLDKIKFDRVRDEYTKFKTSSFAHEEVNFPSTKNSLELYRKRYSNKSVTSVREEQVFNLSEVKPPFNENPAEVTKKQSSLKWMRSKLQEQESVLSDISEKKLTKKSSLEVYKKQLSQKSGKLKQEEEDIEQNLNRTVKFKISKEIQKSKKKDQEELKPDLTKDDAKNEERLKESSVKSSTEVKEIKEISKVEKEDPKNYSAIILKSSPAESLESGPKSYIVKSSEEGAKEDILKAGKENQKDGSIVQNPSKIELPKSELKSNVKVSKEFKNEEVITAVEKEHDSSATTEKPTEQQKPTVELQSKNERKLDVKENEPFKQEDKLKQSSLTVLKQTEDESKSKVDVKEKRTEEECSITLGKPTAEPQPKDEREIKEVKEKYEQNECSATGLEPVPMEFRHKKTNEEETNEIFEKRRKEESSEEFEKKRKEDSSEEFDKKRKEDSSEEFEKKRKEDSSEEFDKKRKEESSEEFDKKSEYISIRDNRRKAVMLPKVQTESEEENFSEPNHVDDPSLLSLFRNITEGQSTFALTREQYEILKENSSDYEKLKEKIRP